MQQKNDRSISLLLFLKALLGNLLVALNFANVFSKNKKRLENLKKTFKNVTKNI